MPAVTSIIKCHSVRNEIVYDACTGSCFLSSASILSAQARVTNSNNYPTLRRSLEIQVAKATNRQKDGSAEESTILAKQNISPGLIHYLNRASALNLKDASAPGFGRNDVVFDIFMYCERSILDMPGN